MARKKHIDEAAAEAADAGGAARELASAERANEKAWQAALRPRTFDDYIGQREMIENLKISVRAAKQRGWALDHFLFAGPPGLGKTTLAHVIANELGVNLHVSSGPAIDHKGMLASLLTALGEGDALFIDEIHRLPPPARADPHPRRGAARQGGDDAAAAVHAAGRNDADGASVGAAARSLRVPLAAALLRPPRH